MVAFIYSVTFACTTKNTPKNKDINNIVLADTIIYDVLLTPEDTLNDWEVEKLRSVNYKLIIDNIFEDIYSGEKKAYDYFTDKRISKKEIKEIEEKNPNLRQEINKLQFTERWTYNNDKHEVVKNIYSILLAQRIFDSSGNVRGYKALFYVKVH